MEYVSAAENVVTLNAQLTQLATQQLEVFVAKVRCMSDKGLEVGSGLGRSAHGTLTVLSPQQLPARVS